MRQAPHARHDQRPGQLGRGDWRACPVGHRNPALGAGRYVNVAANPPGLDNQLQLGQLFNQGPRQVRALADEDNDFSILEPHRQLAQTLHRIGVHLGLKGLQLC